MDNNKNKTLYDSLIEKVKNNKFFAIIIMLGVFVISLETFYGAASRLYQKIFSNDYVETNSDYVEPDIRTRYYDIGGHGLSMLLQGLLDESLQRNLGGKPIIWKNNVYDQLNELHNMYSRNANRLDIRLREENFDLLNLVDTIPLLPGTETDKGSFDWNDSDSDLDFQNHERVFPQNLKDLNRDWVINFVNNYNDNDSKQKIIESLKNGELPAENVEFYRTLRWEDASELLYPKNFYKNFLSNFCPDSFIVAKLIYEYCGNLWAAELSTPRLVLQVLVVENLSNKPITINNLTGTIKKGVNKLSKLDELKEIDNYSELLADGILKADEKLVIPVNLRFTWENISDRFNQQELININKNEIEKLIENYDSIKIIPNNSARLNVLTISSKSLIESFRNKKLDLEDVDFYLLSSSVDIIIANNKEYNIRPHDYGSIFISDFNDSGSCPYLFSTDEHLWGNFLTGRNEKSKEGTYSIPINRYGGKYVLKELENEISYIKWIRVECTKKNGDKFYVYPNQEILDIKNANYLILKKNDCFEIDFPLQSSIFEKYRLQFYGYYEVL